MNCLAPGCRTICSAVLAPPLTCGSLVRFALVKTGDKLHRFTIYTRMREIVNGKTLLEHFCSESLKKTLLVLYIISLILCCNKVQNTLYGVAEKPVTPPIYSQAY